MTAPGSASNASKRLAVAFGPLVVAVALLAWRAISSVLAKTGHAGAALDDAYIHFQYARAIAEGHPMRFQSGAQITSGATSTLWPAMLAPFWWLGARDNAILWPAWALSFAALAALAWETAAWTERLAGRVAAVGSGAMIVAFGGLAWCAASGMEVVPFAWAIARASRRASEWAEASAEARTAGRATELVALAWVAALFRPEGAVTAVFVAVTLAAFARTGALRERARSLAAGCAVIALPLLLWALTGSSRSSTAVVKLLAGSPYYAGHSLTAAVGANVKLLVATLLDGEIWSAEFLPHRGAAVALAGLGAIAVLGARTGLRWRAAAALLVALTMFAPCFYVTFLWNRLRYLWPFATGWIIGLACLARLLGDLAGAIRPRWRVTTGLACGLFTGLLASKIEWALDDVGQSASGIDRQQVTLGRWAGEHLPTDALVGVNDTGAIAYFSNRRTFDIVGLTTRGEAGYWVAGVGSRLEHYERLHASDPSKLPTHFIVYPQWMAMDCVLGAQLQQATVLDATILGGPTMVAYAADWSKLGSGEEPWTRFSGAVIDTVDVADLESEAEHGYELLGAREGEEIAGQGLSPNGDTVVDGGRTQRTRERFVAHLRTGEAARGIVRLEGPAPAGVRVLANGLPVATFDVGDEESWGERTFDIPASAVPGPDGRTRIEVLSGDSPITTFHYWFVAP